MCYIYKNADKDSFLFYIVRGLKLNIQYLIWREKTVWYCTDFGCDPVFNQNSDMIPVPILKVVYYIQNDFTDPDSCTFEM